MHRVTKYTQRVHIVYFTQGVHIVYYTIQGIWVVIMIEITDNLVVNKGMQVIGI